MLVRLNMVGLLSWSFMAVVFQTFSKRRTGRWWNPVFSGFRVSCRAAKPQSCVGDKLSSSLSSSLSSPEVFGVIETSWWQARHRTAAFQVFEEWFEIAVHLFLTLPGIGKQLSWFFHLHQKSTICFHCWVWVLATSFNFDISFEPCHFQVAFQRVLNPWVSKTAPQGFRQVVS